MFCFSNCVCIYRTSVTERQVREFSRDLVKTYSDDRLTKAGRSSVRGHKVGIYLVCGHTV